MYRFSGDEGHCECTLQTSPPGPPGTPGDQGDPGVIGEQGQQGDQGDQGQRGFTGLHVSYQHYSYARRHVQVNTFSHM